MKYTINDNKGNMICSIESTNDISSIGDLEKANEKQRLSEDMARALFYKVLKIEPSDELVEYISKYGYLAKDDIELCGITLSQKDKSDMIQKTIELRKKSNKLKDDIVLEQIHDEGLYAITDGKNVKIFDSRENKIKDLKLSFNEYIYKRLNENFIPSFN